MKMNKWFMLGMVGLAFTACSNEEELGNQLPNGNGSGAISVKIVKPTTKTLSTGTTVAVTGNITVSLYEKTDLENGVPKANAQPKTLTVNTNNVQELTFWNVIDPGLITASINGGVSTYASTTITSNAPSTEIPMWKVAPANVPAYGETSTFTKTGGTGSPDMDNDGTTETGAVAVNENNKYDMYEATVTMAIPMARLEVGLITLDPDQDVYATLEYTGSYLDKYSTNGGAYENGAFKAVTSGFGNYWFEDNVGAIGQGESALKYAASADHDFVDTPISEGGLFNFYAGTTNPQFKLYFKTGTMADNGQTNIQFPRYAMITKYNTATQNDITLQNGHIYQITNVTLDPGNLIPDEEGNTMYGVTVTVEEAEWTVETLTGEWVSQ